MAKTPEQWGLQAITIGPRMQAHLREGVRQAALAITLSVRAELATAAPGGRLSGVGKRGAKIGVGFDDKGLANTAAATQLVKMRGPAHLIERDTKAHPIRPRSRGKRAQRNAAARGERASDRRALAIPGVGVRAYANHPGTKGKHPWEKGVTRATPQAQKIIAASVRRALVEQFRL